MENEKYAIFIGVTMLITFGVGFWAGYYDVFGYLKSICKKKKKFNLGNPAPPDNEEPNDGNRKR